MTLTMLKKIKRHGLKGSATIGLMLFRRRLEPLRKQYELLRLRNAPQYANPTSSELDGIEKDLASLGIKVFD